MCIIFVLIPIAITRIPFEFLLLLLAKISINLYSILPIHVGYLPKMILNTKSRTRSETMKWKGMLVFVALFLCQNVFSQSITWQRTYHVFQNDFGYKILPAPDNCFYFVGSIDNIISSYCYVLKLNQLGDTIWSRKYSGGLYTAALSHDSCCVIVNISDPMQITKIDKLGNILWNRTLPTWFICHDIQRVNDNGFVLCGILNTNAIAVRIDSSGNFIWQKNFSGSSVKGFYSVIESIGNQLVFTGGNENPDTTRIYVVKLDLAGNTIWERNFVANNNRNLGQKIFNFNKSYLIGGFTDVNIYKTFILRIDTAGTLMQSRIWAPYGTSKEFFDDFSVLNTNKIIVSKRIDSSSSYYEYAKVQVLDSNLNTIKEHVYYPSLSYASFSSILPLSNKDILFAGTFDYYLSWSEHRFDMYAVRTDSNLNTSPFPPIGITSNSSIVPSEFFLYQNYPNPFNPSTMIKYDIPKDAVVKVKVYDILGRQVFGLDEFKKAGSYEVRFDGANLSSGMYFYSVKANGFKETKKMVLLK